MDADTFTDLALRVIARDATPDDRQALEAELAHDAIRRADFDELKLSLDLMRAAVPLANALPATEPELPVHRVNELRTAVRQNFGPATTRASHRPAGILSALRWLVAGGGLTGLAFLVVFFCFANRTVEIGVYASDSQQRGAEETLSPRDVPAAKWMAFDQDAPFDRFQTEPLAWYQHAKIWVDNEKDQLHIIERRNGEIVSFTQPLAHSVDGQRTQIQRVIDESRGRQ
jgi:hypothetical protein